jgi:hypothetical protein
VHATVTYGPPLTSDRFRWYVVAETVADHESAICPELLGVAVKLAGAARLTSSVVEPVCVIVPDVPVTVSERA